MRNKNYASLLAILLCFGSCGLSQAEKETARKHFKDVAEQRCACEALKNSANSEPEKLRECTEELNRRTRYMEAFFDVVKPSSRERSEAAKDGDAILAGCGVK